MGTGETGTRIQYHCLLVGRNHGIGFQRDNEPSAVITGRKVPIDRMRPIAMTTFAAILALLPLAPGIGQGAAMQRPLAIAIIAGLSVQHPLVLVILPVMLAWFGTGPRQPEQAPCPPGRVRR
ncbi:MAG: efflux RND transporter permease subunit [Opitutaceae bacterium]